MATNIKKTSVANRVPNTFVLSTDGDIGVNTHDGKMYISNSSNVFEVGANISGNSYVGGNLTIDSGILSWNTLEDCLDIQQEDGSTLQAGLESYIKVRNYTGGILTNGTLVQFSGINGNGNPTCVPLLANSIFDPLYTIGVLTNDIPNGEVGRATTFGKVRGINTTGAIVGESWSAGDLLWASTTVAGGLTKIKPTAPNPAISVAAVTVVGTTTGELLIRPTISSRLYYGSFSDTTTQSAVAANTAYPIKFDTTDSASGHFVASRYSGSNNAIVALVSGLYNYQFSLQFASTTNQTRDIWIWPRKNNVDIPNSATRISITDSTTYVVAAWNFIVSMQANNDFQLMWAASEGSNTISITAFSATAFCPAIPSVILSVTQASL
jgi:hypothetical protein